MSFSSDQPLLANQLPISIDFPPPSEEAFRHTLSLIYKRIANAVNTKEGSLYQLQEIANFQQFFTSGDPLTLRPGYRRVFELSAIAPGGTLNFAHGIVGITQLTNYWAIGNTAADFRKIPFSSTVAVNQQISMVVTTTNVIITNGAAATAITGGIIVLEYLKT